MLAGQPPSAGATTWSTRPATARSAARTSRSSRGRPAPGPSGADRLAPWRSRSCRCRSPAGCGGRRPPADGRLGLGLRPPVQGDGVVLAAVRRLVRRARGVRVAAGVRCRGGCRRPAPCSWERTCQRCSTSRTTSHRGPACQLDRGAVPVVAAGSSRRARWSSPRAGVTRPPRWSRSARSRSARPVQRRRGGRVPRRGRDRPRQRRAARGVGAGGARVGAPDPLLVRGGWHPIAASVPGGSPEPAPGNSVHASGCAGHHWRCEPPSPPAPPGTPGR